MTYAYEAINENPRVFCAYGKNPAQAFNKMSKLLKDHNINWLSAAHVGYSEEDNLYYITIYV